tara:strand:+ start:93 stop:743 length:651 start_codon:yes stop_codon:yes gene_type:complete
MHNKIKIKTSNQNIQYFEALSFMEKKVENILKNQDKEMIWFLNHDHIYTCGTSAHKDEIIFTKDIPVIKTNRGGKTTYHGPGQRIVYFMINLNNRKKDVRRFVKMIELSTISFLKEFDIESKTFPKRIGIWVTKIKNQKLKKEKKIGAIGLRIKKWVTYHGLSFNINPDLSYYKNIHACGLKNYKTTSLSDLGVNINAKDFDKVFVDKFYDELKKF